MKELLEYRKRLLQQLVATAHEFRAACLRVANPFQAVEAEGWNVHQIAAHARDVDRWAYGLRARRTLEEAMPLFQNFDGEAHAREHYSAEEPLSAVVDELVRSTEALAALLRDQPAEVWSRLSRHEKLGNSLTLQFWVERALAHLEEHLATVRKVAG